MVYILKILRHLLPYLYLDPNSKSCIKQSVINQQHCSKIKLKHVYAEIIHHASHNHPTTTPFSTQKTHYTSYKPHQSPTITNMTLTHTYNIPKPQTQSKKLPVYGPLQPICYTLVYNTYTHIDPTILILKPKTLI